MLIFLIFDVQLMPLKQFKQVTNMPKMAKADL